LRMNHRDVLECCNSGQSNFSKTDFGFYVN